MSCAYVFQFMLQYSIADADLYLTFGDEQKVPPRKDTVLLMAGINQGHFALTNLLGSLKSRRSKSISRNNKLKLANTPAQ